MLFITEWEVEELPDSVIATCVMPTIGITDNKNAITIYFIAFMIIVLFELYQIPHLPIGSFEADNSVAFGVIGMCHRFIIC